MRKTPSFFQWFNNISIRKKLLLSYLLVVFLPVLLVGLILTSNMRKMALETATNEASNNVDRVYNRLNETVKVAMDVSYRALIDEKLEELLLSEYGTIWEIVSAYSDYKDFNNYMSFYNREIENIRFYTFNTTLLESGQFLKATDSIQQSPWFLQALTNRGRLYWKYMYDEVKRNDFLSLISLVRGVKTQKDLGVIVISIKGSQLDHMLKDEPYDIMIVDDEDYIVAAKEIGLAGKKLGDAGLPSGENMVSGIQEIHYKGEDFKLIAKTFLPSEINQDFRIVSLVPVRNIEKQTTGVIVLGFSMIAGSLLLALVLILIFSDAISKRISGLSSNMHQVAMGNFNFVPSIEGEDEIGQLSRDLGVMTKSIKDLIHEVYEVTLQKNQLAIRQREIKLRMLASQINPHFLFNVLETIRMKAHCNGQAEIAEVVKLLGKMIRRNLEIGHEMVTLESEIEQVKGYLEIQKFRYGSRIQYEIELDEKMKAYTILPLIIQPIVENAVIHGLESKKGVGTVKVYMHQEEEIFTISVEDNGMGMDEERLQYVRGSLEEGDESPGSRIGLRNVHQRIKLYYGETYGLIIDSEMEKGTKVSIRLPR